MGTLAQQHDCLLVDLDGTVYCGQRLIAGALDSLDMVPGRVLYITNNASRSAVEVAGHLRDLGLAATPDDVVTSAETAARMLADQLPSGGRVLIVGTESLAGAVAAVGLRPVRRYRDKPEAVVQGHSSETAWTDLAEAALAIRDGALWVVTNVDPTLPSERGLVPGTGSMVAALKTATDAEPQVAGKPSPALINAALARGACRAPLVVGDRLAADVAAANAAGVPSMMVLTGADSACDAVRAAPAHRPTYIGHDLSALHQDADLLAVTTQPGWRVETGDGSVTVSGPGGDGGDGLSVVRAVASAVWATDFDGRRVTIRAGDDAAHTALQRWSLV
ncbi:HAD-IIA family hydrolase [Mycobacterium sp.]|uniref:HAD-IIA family hydrolase n=1 Tax=Mycobacterium sp. TaxID=1785 RepID=UPI001289E215|nr:HAD-IIA family hydrolase [Mycobacterium sp.]KAA8959408.1 MAG: HAD-IIA family hydrolase [Mycobacterium sp.]